MKKALHTIILLLIISALPVRSSAIIHQIITAPNGNPYFSSANFSMQLGDTIRWQHYGTDPTIYTIASTTIPSGAAPWTASISSTTPTFQYVPLVLGTYNYQATGIPAMTGQFRVTNCGRPSAIAGGGGSICQGETDSLYVITTNGSTYQWYNNIGPIPGATNSYYLAGTQSSYICIVRNACNDSIFSNQRNIYVFTPAPPTIGFTNNGLTYNFTGTATGATTWSWNFGDMTTSNLQNPQHTYAIAGTYTVTLTTNAILCAAATTQSIQASATGINNVVWGDDILVSPNPATGTININSNEQQLSLSIYDMAGRMIYVPKLVGKTSQTMSFDINNVPAGMYVLRISGAAVISRKLSVVK